ncbi:MAG: glycosyltransferase family 4 protein [Thermoguttaceae bacterium]|jgi:hypothetical protein|nr:glycosyltransferase family 4 protein [Thermoguttaceae bacterium]
MNLVIIHYHLNRGGVTRVIENQLAALDVVLAGDAPWRVAVLYGGRRQGWDEGLAGRLRHVQVTLHEIPELEYDRAPLTNYRGGSAELLMGVMNALDESDFAPDDTVIHAHNHSLGKNAALPEILPILAEDGYALLLQPHDFAEDFRPETFFLVRRLAADGTLYPQAPHIHYAVLNSRDYAILSDCGVPADRLHLLPNPVPGAGELPPRVEARVKLAERFGIPATARFLLYPVRGIRRKNVGEMLLLAAVAPADTIFGLTLGPLNPAEGSQYERWKHLATELDLPCRFEVGGPGGLTFRENLAAADAILTTSVAEGFGMATLEAWLAGCPLIGRDLPEINADFRAEGIQLDGLSPSLRVRVDWVGRETFRDRFAAAYRRAIGSFAQPVPKDLSKQIDAKMGDGWVDFADLDPMLQEQVVRKVAADRASADVLFAENPWLGEALCVTKERAAKQIAANVEATARAYSLQPSGKRLLTIYHGIAGASRNIPPKPLPDPGSILERFLTPARFRPLRVAVPET